MLSAFRQSPRFSPGFRRLAGQPVRMMASGTFNAPAPPSLPREQQREFKELLRSAQAPLSASTSKADAEAELALHPDARKPLKPEFEGDINPKTGEEGGPKREPVRQWIDGDGDWSHKGRVTDF
ncbi:hypothetical protein FIBSPDRAFT_846703 [Athelia psychrophila]|uniref:Succinate dehydrogenase assembly factor 4, mitochondrial n=1 Tax=Athelia psychrophila TaxID=1759441 RepID=A0A166XBF0_9AGAM|nr:hypothetical protein FIBSPDRAFT_846703 [Fibularhizoctonia sp. CBS 109695]